MSVEPPSSNPFRRRATVTLPSAFSGRSSTNSHSSRKADTRAYPDSIERSEVTKKFTKKVRMQSPPPPSPPTPSHLDSSSTISEEAYDMPERSLSLTPPISRKNDPFDSVSSDLSDEEDERLSKAPANPFSKTLETMEHPERGGAITSSTNTSNPGRASMDVDAFKRLLLTGNAGLATPITQSAAQTHEAYALGNGGSSTDISSISRQSIFEAVQEPFSESPRTSHEISEPENNQSGLVVEALASSATRKKPPPPSSRRGRLIKVELKDQNTPIGLQSPPTPGSITSQHYFSSSPRSQTDLNKPLPLAPSRASHDSDHESVFDKESAGKLPELPLPYQKVRPKAPPAPPLTRRHSQRVAETKLSRGDSNRLSPKPEEDSAIILGVANENKRTPSSESIKIPPLPPPRRSGSVRGPSNNPLTSPSTVSLPAPPPARGSRSVSGGKPPSVLNMDTSPAIKRSSVIAPPPPPPRHRHRSTGSIEGNSPGTSRRPSPEHVHHCIEPRRGSSTPSLLYAEPVQTEDGKHKLDILADLSKLQREIDTLRSQSEDRRIT
ncbi:hypothetical protein BUE80_DR002983 [Diplocarpon rosae]|nr:hypothetical protein BUE80_DR002983 [Diplocarpon rosae]